MDPCEPKDEPVAEACKCDISCTSGEMIVEQGAINHQSLMVESRGNTQMAHSMVRLTGAQKFNREDPIEAASVEMVLSGGSVSGQTGPA